MEWKEVRINEVGHIGRGKSKHRPRNDKSLYGGKYPFIQTGDVKSSEFYITKFSQTYSELGLAQSKLWDTGTLLITIAANIGETAILTFPACFPDSIIGFSPYPEKSDIKFIKYYLDKIKQQLILISKGTTQDNLSVDKLLSIKLNLPPLPTQKKIAQILSTYDDLIENNNRRIELLEKTAKNIYKEWFVRFRFPGYKNTKFIDGIPEGWGMGKLADIVEINKGKNITKDTITEGQVPVVAGGIEPAYYHNKANTQSPTITVSASGANAGYVNLYYKNIWASDCSYIDTKATKYLYFVYSVLKSRQKEVFYLQKGSAQPHVYPKDLKSLTFLIPPIYLIQDFEEQQYIVFNEIKVLSEKNNKLRQARNRLLPKLISGKLSTEHLIRNQTSNV